jgi:hypothetical protein
MGMLHLKPSSRGEDIRTNHLLNIVHRCVWNRVRNLRRGAKYGCSHYWPRYCGHRSRCSSPFHAEPSKRETNGEDMLTCFQGNGMYLGALTLLSVFSKPEETPAYIAYLFVIHPLNAGRLRFLTSSTVVCRGEWEPL